MYFANNIYVISSMGTSLIFICYRVTPGFCRPTSVTRRVDTGALPPMPGAEPLHAYRDSPRHTLAPPGLHRECNVANRSITGTDRDHFLLQTGPGP